MNSVEQRLQIKREPLDKWSIREQLCLASAVARSGDQNWMSVSRALKPFGDPNRPSDWFHQKNCAAQYGSLLANVETPKRKKRTSGGDFGIETPAECILRQLKTERIVELKKLLAEEKAEYLKLQENMTLLTSGKFSEDQLDKWCKEIDEEDFRKEQETLKHALWLKERESKKQEVEKVWRPNKLTQSSIGQKRKNSDSFDSLLDSDHQNVEDNSSNSNNSIQDSSKPSLALSPLLTSLLKSPSQVQSINQSSILHPPIANQRPVVSNNTTHKNTNTSTNTVTNPMIASLLNSTANVAVSPGLQQLVSTAIGQETDNAALEIQQADLATADILDDEALNNLKIEEITNSIIVPDGPLPEMKNDVDVIISDLIADPEQHLQLDNNGDININLELDDLEDSDELEVESEQQQEEQSSEVIETHIIKQPEIHIEKTAPPIDPFEFQEDPEYEPKIPMKQLDSNKPLEQNKQQYNTQSSPEQQLQDEEESLDEEVELIDNTVEITGDGRSSDKKEGIKTNAGSVEIVEVAMEEEEVRKVLDKTQIQDIVHSSKVESIDDATKISDQKPVKEELDIENEISKPQFEPELTEANITLQVDTEVKVEVKIEDKSECTNTANDLETRKNLMLHIDPAQETSTVESTFTDEFYDDIQMEVKIDKTGKAKRDYSRTKKKEEKDFDILLAIEKAHMEDSDLLEDFSDKEFTDRKDEGKKEEIKSENERSNSPWTEEEDVSSIQSKRRVSTPATPIDSVPNSPASSSAYYDDDKDYRNWKKSIMLVYSWLAAHKYSSLFLKPITEDQAPSYHSLIYRPMDFQTIRKNIENGVIRTTQEFKRDVMLMLNNAIMYNKTNGTVYNMTREIQQEAVESIQLLLQAQSSEGTPPRRETRLSEPNLKRKRGPDENIRSKKRKED